MGCFALDAFEPGGFLVLSVLIGVGVVTQWVWRQDAFPGKRVFLYANIGMMFWLVTALAEIQSLTLDCKVAWATRAWVAIAFVPTAWAIFLWHYAFGVHGRESLAHRVALFLGPAVISVVVWTNPSHQMFYGPETRMAVIGGVEAVIYDHGPLFYASAAYLYTFMVFSTVIVLVGAFQSHKVHRAYFLMLIFVNCVPMVANLAYVVFGFTVYGFDPTPFAFSVVLLLFTILIFTNRLFDVNTVARDLLFFNAQSPILVVDGRGVVVGLNHSAEAVFPGCHPGTPLADLPELGLGPGEDRVPSAQDIPETLDVGGRHMEVQITIIPQALQSRTESMGFVIMLHDTTKITNRNTTLAAALNTNTQRLREIEALRDELQAQVMIDPLTGLNNRRGLDDTFANFKPLSADRGMVIALLDIDHFKSINDRFGHAAGDRVLRDFARALRVHVKAGIPVFRVGGEEFLIMFPDADLEQIADFIADFRNSLRTGQFVRLTDPEQIDFSAGLGCWPQDGATLDHVMKSADDRLYLAKLAGRGRTVSKDNVVRIATS